MTTTIASRIVSGTIAIILNLKFTLKKTKKKHILWLFITFYNCYMNVYSKQLFVLK